MLDLMNEDNIVITPDGDFYKLSALFQNASRLGRRWDALAAQFDKIGTIFWDVHGGYSLHSMKHNDAHRLFKTFPQMQINSNFVCDGDKFYPFFGRVDRRQESETESSEYASMSVTWKPPANMRLLFVCLFKKEKWLKAFIVALNVTTKDVYQLPLPNIYPGGKLCLGEEYEVPRGVSIFDSATECLEYFQGAKWNSDLLSDNAWIGNKYKTMFSFDADGKQLYTSEDWTGLCDACSSDDYNYICEAMLS